MNLGRNEFMTHQEWYIRQKRYYEAFWNPGKPVIGISVNFSSVTKNIEAWKEEEMG
jgi:hypothetical protein